MAIAFVGNAALMTVFLRHQREQEALVAEIDATIHSIQEYGDVTNSLGQLAIVKSELAAEQDAFQSQLSRPGTVDALLQLAQEVGLEVRDLNTKPGKEQKVGEHTYQALLVLVQAEATLVAIQSFVGELEDGALRAVTVDELSITGIKQPLSDKSEDSVIASLDISVYERQ